MATVMGPMIATVKNIVSLVLQQVVNTVIQPILNDQTTSLSTLFGGVSVDTIASYGPGVFANITSTINSESSQLSSVGSTMGSMMSSLSVFSGAGTILGPLISMAGPGIMVTVMSMIASVVMSTVLTPLFSQFNSTVLQDDLNTLMKPLGGIATGGSAILNDITALTSSAAFFMMFYVVQKVAKMLLFFDKLPGSQDPESHQSEIYLYVFSIICNALQMVFG